MAAGGSETALEADILEVIQLDRYAPHFRSCDRFIRDTEGATHPAVEEHVSAQAR